MSLKAADIDPFLLATLYHQPVIQKKSEAPEPEDQRRPLPSLGNNRQNILLLIRNEEDAYLSEPVFALLSNLLKACRLSLDDVALVNTAHLPEINYYRLSQHFTPHKVILFGNALPELSGQNPPNASWEEAGCQLLYTDSLDAMYHDKQLKVPFWNALRLFFNLSV